MIRQIYIANFQSHEQNTLELSQGVNVIIGPTDSGKSAIIRALRWLIENRPTGAAFRSWWGGDTEVGAEMYEGTWVRRLRGKNINAYHVENESGQAEYKALGRDIPEEVCNTLRVLPVSLQLQMDPPYMLSLSPGEAARQLNDAAGLDAIDRAMSNLNARRRSTASQLQAEQKQFQREEEELCLYAHIPEMERQVKHLEHVAAETNKTRREEHTLRTLLAELSRADDVLSEFHGIEKAHNVVQDLSDKAQESKELHNLISHLTEIMKRSHQSVKSVARLDSEAARLEKEWRLEMGDTCPLCGQEGNFG